MVNRIMELADATSALLVAMLEDKQDGGNRVGPKTIMLFIQEHNKVTKDGLSEFWSSRRPNRTIESIRDFDGVQRGGDAHHDD